MERNGSDIHYRKYGHITREQYTYINYKLKINLFIDLKN